MKLPSLFFVAIPGQFFGTLTWYKALEHIDQMRRAHISIIVDGDWQRISWHWTWPALSELMHHLPRNYTRKLYRAPLSEDGR